MTTRKIIQDSLTDLTSIVPSLPSSSPTRKKRKMRSQSRFKTHSPAHSRLKTRSQRTRSRSPRTRSPHTRSKSYRTTQSHQQRAPPQRRNFLDRIWDWIPWKKETNIYPLQTHQTRRNFSHYRRKQQRHIKKTKKNKKTVGPHSPSRV